MLVSRAACAKASFDCEAGHRHAEFDKSLRSNPGFSLPAASWVKEVPSALERVEKFEREVIKL